MPTLSYRFIAQRLNVRLLFSIPLLFVFLANSQAVRADEIQDRFDEAMAAVEADKLNTARRLLTSLLADYPTLYRARLELARVDYLVRDFEEADAELTKVLEDPELPPSVRTNLLAFQAQIRDDQRTFEKKNRWNAQLYAGGLYDTNVNFGTSRDIVDIGGVPGIVLPTSKPIESFAGVVDGGVLHTFNPGWSFESGENTGYFVWQSQLNGYYRGYTESDAKDFDLGIATLRTGPAWVVPKEWSATIGLQVDQLWLGSERLGLFWTINPNFIWDIDEKSQLSVGVAYTKRTYNENTDDVREGDLIRANLGYSRVFADGLFGIQAGIGYTDFDAKLNIFTFKGPEGFIGGNWNAWTRGSLYTSFGYRNFDFQGTDLLFGQSRDDDEYRFILGARQQLNRNWALKAEWVYTDNKSNLDLFDFDRDQISVGVQRTW